MVHAWRVLCGPDLFLGVAYSKSGKKDSMSLDIGVRHNRCQVFLFTSFPLQEESVKRKKTDNQAESCLPTIHLKPREAWEDGTPPPHRDFKERCVVR